MPQNQIKEKIEEKFSDQFFWATNGRNDIRRNKILELFTQREKEILEEIYRFIFKDLSGEPLEDREAKFVEKYPFVHNEYWKKIKAGIKKCQKK